MRKLRNTRKKKIDKKLLGVTLLLVGIGLVAVADASAPSALANFSDKFHFARQQVISAIIGIVLMAAIANIDYKIWSKFATPLFGAGLLGLLIVLIPSLGSNFLGARRWILIGGFSVQPAELMKLSLAIYLAKVADSKGSKNLMALLIPVGIVGLLVMMEPDLGTTIVLSLIAIVQFFIAGIPVLYLVGLNLAGVLGGMLLILTSSYRRDRLLTFMETTSDPLGKGYHIRQILFALGSGGLLGVGIGQSRQKYLFLPEAATDSIFAVIAEEVGFLGVCFLILIICYFVYLGFKVVRNAPDTFSKVLASGIVAWIGGQSLINIAAMVSLVPLTGIPLPFISYGGSSLITVLIATGILLNISSNGDK